MRRLDLHIGRSFLEPFLVATALIVGLYIVGDAFNRLDSFLEQSGGIGTALLRMAEVYFLRLPTFLAPVLPIAMLIGAAYGIAHLSGHNELMAMQVCGVSFWRILAPVYVIAAIISLLGFANREFLVPKAERIAIPMMQGWMGQADKSESVVDFIEAEKTQYLMNYYPVRRTASNVMILFRDETKEPILAQEAKPVKDGWLLKQATVGGKPVKEWTWQTALRPADVQLTLLSRDMNSQTGTMKQLSKLIRGNPLSATFRLRYQERMTYPFTGLVLVGLGLPFVVGSEKIRRSRVLGIGVCVIIAGVFYVVQMMASQLGESRMIPVALAAWLPIIVFGALGIYMLETVHS